MTHPEQPTETTPLLANPSTNPENEPTTTSNPFTATLSTHHAASLLISIIIGAGVFSSPGPIDANVPSPLAALLIWALGGLLAWTGALTLAELGTAIPGAGGVQEYLTRVYGEYVGYAAAWSWVVATMPATLAILSTVFAECVGAVVGWDASSSNPGIVWAKKGVAVGMLVVVGAANSVSTRVSTRLSGLFVAVKMVTVSLLLVCGGVIVGVFLMRGTDLGNEWWHTASWTAPRRDVEMPDGSRLDWTQVSAWEAVGFYSAALYGALWAYSGWDKANYVAAELKNPSRQLPLAINTAIPLIILCYIATNAVYYLLLPWTAISTTDAAAVVSLAILFNFSITFPLASSIINFDITSLTAYQDAINAFLGPIPAIIATVLICFVIAGSALGNSFVAGRMTVAAASKGWFPKVFGSVGRIGSWTVVKSARDDAQSDEIPGQIGDEEAGDAPINALLLNIVLSTVYILLGNMRILLTFNGLAEYAFFFLTVLGAIILRFREPELHRPVKPFIGIPIVFALISGLVVLRGAVFAPGQAGVLVAVWALGGIWWVARKWNWS